MPVDAWNIDMATTIARELDKGSGVEFGGQRRIYGDAPPGLQMEIAVGVAGDELGYAVAFTSRDGSTLGP
jgi:hypothetical protein